MKKLLLFICITFVCEFPAQMMPYVDNNDGRCTYTDKRTGKIMNFFYDECPEFENNRALVKNEGRYFVIDTLEVTIKEFPYKYMKTLKKGEYIFCDDTIAGTVSSKGDMLNSTQFKNSYKCGNVTSLIVLRKDSLVGIFSKDVGILLPVEYISNNFEDAFMLDNELYFDERAVFCLKYKGKYGVVDVNGKTIVPFEYDNANHSYHNELIGVSKNSKWGLMNKGGKLILPIEYDSYQYKDNVLHLVKQGKHGIYSAGNVKWDTK